jgi:hypothetical protein
MNDINKDNIILAITKAPEFDFEKILKSWLVLKFRMNDFDPSLVTKLIKMEFLLFQRAECIYGDFSFQNTRKYAHFILSWLAFYRLRGFVTLDDISLENNPLFKIYYDVFGKSENQNILFVREHMCNLLILSVIRNLYMTLQTGEKPLTDMTKEEDEEFGDVFDLINIFRYILSPGLRNSISKNRIRLEERVCTGFDTEYTNLEYGVNKLLCATTSTFTRTFLILTYLRGPIDLDFKINGNYSDSASLPKHLSSLIFLQILAIRHIGGRADDSVDSLSYFIERLGTLKGLEIYKEHGKLLISIKKDIHVDNFITTYEDFNDPRINYSLSWLINTCFHNSKELRTKELLGLLDKISEIAFENSMIFKFNIHKKRVFISIDNSIEFETRRKEVFILIAHFTIADICSWSDYEDIKEDFDIVQKSVVTRQRPVTYKAVRIILRDTMLLSVGTGSSLAAIGKLYTTEGGPEKISIDEKWYRMMEVFKEEDLELFKRYAKNDAIVSLYHALKVEVSNFKLNKKFDIPVSLGSMASSFITSQIDVSKYEVPTPDRNFSVQDLSKVYTPIGIELSEFGHYLFFFLGSYHGGRNESFVFGTYRGVVYDYDLPGAYSTAMSLLGVPDYEALTVIGPMDVSDFERLYWDILFYSYTALRVRFKFPTTVKYPNIPVRIDKSSIIFPFEGESYITGLEYRLAIRLGCVITILGGCVIPFITQTKKSLPTVLEGSKIEGVWKILEHELSRFSNAANLSDTLILRQELMKQISKTVPDQDQEQEVEGKMLITFDKGHGYSEQSFYTLVKHLTLERSKYDKGTYYNQLYKLLANAGIGQFGRGLSRKMQYSPKVDTTVVVGGGPLSNPLLGGWITSFIRCVLSEILNDLHPRAIVISCTTDGFITSQNLEDYNHEGEFAKIYLTARKNLGDDPVSLLERKHTDQFGIISWSTRGQVGLQGDIKATTGLRVSKEKALAVVTDAFSTDDRSYKYISMSLRSPNTIYKAGGMVTPEYSEKVFNPVFDNRREIIPVNNQDLLINGMFDPLSTYLSTKPFHSAQESILSRQLARLSSRKYTGLSGFENHNSKSQTYLNLCIRMFIRVCYHRPDILGIDQGLYRLEILSVLNELGINKVPNYISVQKRYKFMENSIPKIPSTLSFVESVKIIYPKFNESLFLSK